MLPEEKTAILIQIRSAEGHIGEVINMVERRRNCEEVLLQLQALQIALHNTGQRLLLYQLQRSIENISRNACPEERSAEIERLVELYRFFLMYA